MVLGTRRAVTASAESAVHETLLFAMAASSEPTSGEVGLAGGSSYALDAGARAALRRTGIGFVFELRREHATWGAL